MVQQYCLYVNGKDGYGHNDDNSDIDVNYDNIDTNLIYSDQKNH